MSTPKAEHDSLLGQHVLYRTDGRNGLVYDLPAIITVTRASHPGDYPDGRRNPLPVPESALHVHLTVFTPGGFGTRVEVESGSDSFGDEVFIGAETFTPGSGTYVEWNVPHYAWVLDKYIGEPFADLPEDGVPPRTWR